MNSYLLLLLPLAIFLVWVISRAPNSQATSSDHPNFFTKAAESMNVVKDSVLIDTGSQVLADSEYVYDVVGESYRRDNLTALIRAHMAFDTGQIFSTAVLEMEPTNEFDSSAVKVVVEGTQVGYIPKFDSPAVTEMIKKSGKKVYEVPVRVGWDTNSPSPLIGVRLALTVE
jgi:hypothetical protein